MKKLLTAMAMAGSLLTTTANAQTLEQTVRSDPWFHATSIVNFSYNPLVSQNRDENKIGAVMDASARAVICPPFARYVGAQAGVRVTSLNTGIKSDRRGIQSVHHAEGLSIGQPCDRYGFTFTIAFVNDNEEISGIDTQQTKIYWRGIAGEAAFNYPLSNNTTIGGRVAREIHTINDGQQPIINWLFLGYINHGRFHVSGAYKTEKGSPKNLMLAKKNPEIPVEEMYHLFRGTMGLELLHSANMGLSGEISYRTETLPHHENPIGSTKVEYFLVGLNFRGTLIK